ncbi:MAG: class I SAM-dependent methyltransferase [Thermoleophilia bacterium]
MGGIEDFRAGQRAMWGAGEFDWLARMIWSVGGLLVSRLEIGPGDDVVDIGCGTGNVAIQAAQAGARVTGVDLAPEMLAQARVNADAEGLAIAFIEGDAEDLPLADASADVAVSSFANMFAPRHEIAASEMLRILRPGGRFGMAAWSAEGTINAFLLTVAAHLPPLPPFARPPALWGDPEHVRSMFDRPECAHLDIGREQVVFEFSSADAATSSYTERFGPLLVARRMLEPRGAWAPLVDDIRAFFARLQGPEGAVLMPSDYLLITGRRGRC